MFNKVLVFLFSLTLTCGQAFGQATLLPNAKQTFVDINGAPLASGTVDLYVPNTNTRKNTWTNSTETSLNTNPVMLDAAGRAIIYGQGSYRQVVKDSIGNTQWDALTTAPPTSGSVFLTDAAPVGTMLVYSGLTLPTNYLWAYGQSLNRTTFATLLSAITSSQAVSSVISTTTLGGFTDTTQFKIGAAIEGTCLSAGTTIATVATTTITVSAVATSSGSCTVRVFPYGAGNGVTTFNAPDMRGRVPAGRDNIGGTAANILTNTYCVAASALGLGSVCGTQSKTLLTANLPAYTPAGTVVSPAHNHFISNTDAATSLTALSPANFLNTSANYTGGPSSYTLSGSATTPTVGLTSDTTTTSTFTGTAQGGTSTAFSAVQPSIVVNYIIKYQASDPSGAGGVISLGGMTGDILCGAGVSCTSQTISFSGPGTGDVIGPSSATDNAIVRFDGITGKLIKNSSLATISDDGIISSAGAAITRAVNATADTGLSSTMTMTGNIPGSVGLAYNLINITSDNANISGANFGTALGIQHSYGGSTVQGGRIGLTSSLTHTAATNASNINRNYVSSQYNMFVDAPDNGTGTLLSTAKGAFFGVSTNVIARTGATNLLNITGYEANVAAETGSSLYYKSGIQIVEGPTDQVAASTYDTALAISAQTGAIGQKHAILIGDMNSKAPLTTAGTLFGVTGVWTIDKGIDLGTGSTTYSTYAWRSPGATIDGIGKFQINGAVVGNLYAAVQGNSSSPATSGVTPNGTFGLPTTNDNGIWFGSYTGSPFGGWIQSSNRIDLSLTYPLILNPRGGHVAVGSTDPGSSALLVSNIIGTGGNQGINILVTQLQSNSSDTGDSVLHLDYNLTAASATNELVARVMDFGFTNTLTGGGAITNARLVNIAHNTAASTTTTSLNSIYIESGIANGTVTTGYGLRIASLQGTTKWGVADDSGGNWYNTGFIKTGVTTVGALPSCVAGIRSARTFVTDSNAASYTAGIGAVVAAGGSTNVPVICDGTNWRIG